MFIAAVDLIEAEGRELRRSAARLGWGLGFIGLALLLAAVGAGLCLWSLYAFSAPAIGPAGAGLLTGVVTLILALVSGWIAQWMNR